MKHLEKLKRCVEQSQRGVVERTAKHPWRMVYPRLLGKMGLIRTKVAPLYFGRQMAVVLPEAVSMRLWRFGFFEHDVAFYLMSSLRPGDTFLDVGGHFGFFSMLGRELVQANGTVVTFEPMPETRAVLERNMAEHAGPAHHHLIPAAASNTQGSITFKNFGVLGSAYATSGEVRNAALSEISSIDVKTTTIDETVKQLGLSSCRLIKIDAENAEYEVVTGALETIRSWRPWVIIEAGDDDEGAASTRRVVDLLLDENYKAMEFGDWALVPHEPRKTYSYQNLLFIPQEDS